MKYYDIHPKFHLAVDCIIFGFDDGVLSLLLLKRNFEPAKGEWSLMGGFVNENESVDEAAGRVLKELTGLENVYMDQIGAFGEIDRDPGERVVSIAYYALIDIKKHDNELVREHNAHWIPLNEVPELIFDHNRMVRKALSVMRHKSSDQPIGMKLLPKEFTLSKLQRLYEAILGEPLDKRNFRKRIAEMDYIEKTGRIDKTESRKGAALYRFNERKYHKGSKFKI
ncbi:MAG: NUDIX hydrolase [Bacteroidales bacterium]|nr:NUDIX hydrolase [Bacteroidales bacterium]MBQ8811416.1 NUDIX hydrolase [Bacteroidales bacterium]